MRSAIRTSAAPTKYAFGCEVCSATSSSLAAARGDATDPPPGRPQHSIRGISRMWTLAWANMEEQNSSYSKAHLRSAAGAQRRSCRGWPSQSPSAQRVRESRGGCAMWARGRAPATHRAHGLVWELDTKTRTSSPGSRLLTTSPSIASCCANVSLPSSYYYGGGDTTSSLYVLVAGFWCYRSSTLQ